MNIRVNYYLKIRWSLVLKSYLLRIKDMSSFLKTRCTIVFFHVYCEDMCSQLLLLTDATSMLKAKRRGSAVNLKKKSRRWQFVIKKTEKDNLFVTNSRGDALLTISGIYSNSVSLHAIENVTNANVNKSFNIKLKAKS